MCGRYSITVDKSTIEYHFNAKFVSGQIDFEATYNAPLPAPPYHHHLRAHRDYARQVGLRARGMEELTHPAAEQRALGDRGREADVPR